MLLRTQIRPLSSLKRLCPFLDLQRCSSTFEIKLRQYQEECIASVLSQLQAGSKRLGVSLATGSGKTVVFSHLIDRVPPNPATGGKQTIILAHRRELVEQAVRHCMLANPNKTVEVEMGRSKATGRADITVASVQSINSQARLRKFDPSRFKLVLVDEAHHIVANTFRNVLQHMKLWQGDDQTASPALIGVSATFSRFDGLQLGAAIDQIVDYIDMIGEKWLSDIVFTTVKSHVDLDKVKTATFGDFNLESLGQACNTKEANEIAVRTWLAKAEGRKSTLVFCVDTAHVAALAETFRKHGVDAQYVLGKDRTDDRRKKLDAFKDGAFPVMLNCGVFTEGTDIPNIDCILLARPTRSRNLLVQMIGRGMRLFPGKANCHVIDMVASLSTGIVTTPTLFGLDPDRLVEEATVDDMRKKSDAERENAARSSKSGAPISKVTFTEYASIHDLLQDQSQDQFIRKLSRNAWVNVGEGRYVLVNRFGDYVTIEPKHTNGPQYWVRFNERVSVLYSPKQWRPVKRAEPIAMAESFDSAVHAADTFIANHQKFERFMTLATASWRKSLSTTDQLEFLNKTIGKENPLQAEDVTKGQAADMITKLKFGARGRFDKIMASVRKSQQADERLAELRKREQVNVGPLHS